MRSVERRLSRRSWRGIGSASARAREASARRRHRPRSRVGMAARGLKVAVLTIDPAKRLADSLGLDELGNVAGPGGHRRLGGPTIGEARRALGDDARLEGDVRRADRHATRPTTQPRGTGSSATGSTSRSPARWPARRSTWRWRSSTSSTTEGDYDLLILDTPPSRNALDFLDAPQRVTQFIEGRAMRLFIRPTGFGARVAGRGFGVVSSVLRRITGGDLIADLSEFFSAMAGLLGGFRDRAERVEGAAQRRRDDVPRGDGARRRADRGGGLPAPQARRGRLALRRPDRQPRSPPGRGLRANPGTRGRPRRPYRKSLGDASLAARRPRRRRPIRRILADRDRRNIDALAADEPGAPLIEVPELSDEIHDIEGLQALGRHLFE